MSYKAQVPEKFKAVWSKHFNSVCLLTWEWQIWAEAQETRNGLAKLLLHYLCSQCGENGCLYYDEVQAVKETELDFDKFIATLHSLSSLGFVTYELGKNRDNGNRVWIVLHGEGN